MKSQHPQTAHTAVDARTAENHPPQNRTLPQEHTHHRGRIAISTAAAAAGVVALTTLILGVSAGARADAPPSPNVAPSAETAAHSDSGSLDNYSQYVATADGECRLNPRYLPHTPDAVEGWYANCHAK
jgi:hypothetical protein